MIFSKTKNIIKSLIPSNIVIHQLPRHSNNSILLTFDDGPDRDITPLILNRLKRHNVKAIFFVIGQKVEAAPDIITMIYEQGHIIGNHTYSHPYENIPNYSQYKLEISTCQNLIHKKTGTKPTLFRPPMGIISPTALLATKSHGMTTMLWSDEGGEWGFRKEETAQTISFNLLKTLRPRDIVLLHDNNLKTPTILDIILPELLDRKIDLNSAASLISQTSNLT
jgi:peptidoglycan/xylan/chitin deacetylase (PgdA/CDA1 family)